MTTKVMNRNYATKVKPERISYSGVSGSMVSGILNLYGLLFNTAGTASALLHFRFFSPGFLQLATFALFLEASFLGRSGWPDSDSRPGRLGRLPDKQDQPCQRILPVGRLGSVPAGFNHQKSVGVDAPTGQFAQPCLNLLRQGGFGNIEKQLDGRGDLIYILAAGTGSTDEGLLDLVFTDEQIRRYLNHGEI